jgi:hypothetical protein
VCGTKASVKMIMLMVVRVCEPVFILTGMRSGEVVCSLLSSDADVGFATIFGLRLTNIYRRRVKNVNADTHFDMGTLEFRIRVFGHGLCRGTHLF